MTGMMVELADVDAAKVRHFAYHLGVNESTALAAMIILADIVHGHTEKGHKMMFKDGDLIHTVDMLDWFEGIKQDYDEWVRDDTKQNEGNPR